MIDHRSARRAAKSVPCPLCPVYLPPVPIMLLLLGQLVQANLPLSLQVGARDGEEMGSHFSPLHHPPHLGSQEKVPCQGTQRHSCHSALSPRGSEGTLAAWTGHRSERVRGIHGCTCSELGLLLPHTASCWLPLSRVWGNLYFLPRASSGDILRGQRTCLSLMGAGGW